MWGILSLRDSGNTKSSVIPNEIHLDCSKRIHFIGRVPNVSGKFKHKVQHFITLTFLSGTHCSIAIDTTDDIIKYTLSDYSSNGTFYKPYNPQYKDNSDFDDATLIGNSNSIEIQSNDYIIFKFQNSPNIVYQFLAVETSIEVIQNTNQQISTLIPTTIVPKTNNFNDTTVLQNSIKQLQDDNTLLQQRYFTLVTKNETAQQDILQLKIEIQDYQDKIQSYEGDVIKYKENIMLLESNHAAVEAYSRKLKDSLQLLKEEYTQLSSKYQESKEDIVYKTEQVKNKDILIEEINKTLQLELTQKKVLEQQYKELQEKFHDSTVYNERIKQTNSILQGIIHDQKQEIKLLQEIQEETMIKMTEKVQKDEQYKKNCQKMIQSLEASIYTLKDTLDNHNIVQDTQEEIQALHDTYKNKYHTRLSNVSKIHGYVDTTNEVLSRQISSSTSADGGVHVLGEAVRINHSDMNKHTNDNHLLLEDTMTHTQNYSSFQHNMTNDDSDINKCQVHVHLNDSVQGRVNTNNHNENNMNVSSNSSSSDGNMIEAGHEHDTYTHTQIYPLLTFSSPSDSFILTSSSNISAGRPITQDNIQSNGIHPIYNHHHHHHININQEQQLLPSSSSSHTQTQSHTQILTLPREPVSEDIHISTRLMVPEHRLHQNSGNDHLGFSDNVYINHTQNSMEIQLSAPQDNPHQEYVPNNSKNTDEYDMSGEKNKKRSLLPMSESSQDSSNDDSSSNSKSSSSNEYDDDDINNPTCNVSINHNHNKKDKEGDENSFQNTHLNDNYDDNHDRNTPLTKKSRLNYEDDVIHTNNNTIQRNLELSILQDVYSLNDVLKHQSAADTSNKNINDTQDMNTTDNHLDNTNKSKDSEVDDKCSPKQQTVNNDDNCNDFHTSIGNNRNINLDRIQSNIELNRDDNNISYTSTNDDVINVSISPIVYKSTQFNTQDTRHMNNDQEFITTPPRGVHNSDNVIKTPNVPHSASYISSEAVNMEAPLLILSSTDTSFTHIPNTDENDNNKSHPPPLHTHTVPLPSYSSHLQLRSPKSVCVDNITPHSIDQSASPSPLCTPIPQVPIQRPIKENLLNPVSLYSSLPLITDENLYPHPYSYSNYENSFPSFIPTIIDPSRSMMITKSLSPSSAIKDILLKPHNTTTTTATTTAAATTTTTTTTATNSNAVTTSNIAVIAAAADANRNISSSIIHPSINSPSLPYIPESYPFSNTTHSIEGVSAHSQFMTEESAETS